MPSEDVLRRAVALADSVPDDEERADLYTGISVLGGLRHSRDLIHSMIRSEQMSRSVIYDEIVEEGALRAGRDYVVDVLEERFEGVPRDLRAKLDSVQDSAELSRLLRLAVRSRTLEAFLTSMRLPTEALAA